MRRISVWLLAAACAATAQMKATREMDHGVGIMDSGETLHYRTVIEPSLQNSTLTPKGGGFAVRGNSMQHFIYDQAAQSFFGYQMIVMPGANANSRQVTFGPLVVDAMRNSLKAVAGDLPLNPAPLPKYPPPQTIYDGDTIALDLMVSSDGRQRIVDYIQFSFGNKPVVQPPAMTDEPRDFTIDDGAVEYQPNAPEIHIDGKKTDVIVIALAGRGATLWFYFPGRGRYLLSLVPHEGFVKAGVVRAAEIRFRADGHEYEIHMLDPIAGTEHAWNLYVKNDPGFLPRPTLVNRIVGSADRMENLLAR